MKKHSFTSKVWPSTGQLRKWHIQNDDEISIYGSFSYVDEFSTKHDLVNADIEMFYGTFEGWRDSTEAEHQQVILQLDQDDYEQLQSGDE